jgi:hypothetical protein
MSQTPESRSREGRARPDDSLRVDDSPSVEESLRVEESPSVEASLRVEESPSIDASLRVEESPSIEALLRVEESPSIDELCIDDEVSVDDMRLLEEQFAAESAWWTANLPGGLIEEEDVLDGDLVSAAAEVERFANGYLGRLDSLLDDVAQNQSALAMEAARLAVSVERSRAWAVVSDELVLPDLRMTPRERLEWVMRTFVGEVAARLQLPQPTAARLVEESRTLVHELPHTLDALGTGRISHRHAQVIIDHAKSLPVSARAGFEDAVLDAAARLSVSQFQKMATRTREQLHPASITVRTARAVTDRRLVLEADTDGMGWLHHYLPIAEAHAAYARITALAASLNGEGETRTLPQRRSDVTTQLMLDGAVVDPAELDAAAAAAGAGANPEAGTAGRVATAGKTAKQPRWGIRPTVFVTVPVMTLLGGEEPGQLDGYGPIDPDTARRLAAKAPSFIRLLTHPETGIVLSMGRKRYKVPTDLLLWVKMRDGTCRKPFCNQPAAVTQLDHTAAWGNGGPTADSNLACLCESCHQMKHRTTWTVKQLGGGVLEWTTPLGHIHITRPAIELPSTSLPSSALPDSPPTASTPHASPDGSPDGSADAVDEPPPF